MKTPTCLLFFCCLSFLMAGERVENGLTPNGKPKKIQFKEDLRIDQEIGDLVWAGASAMIDVDGKGRMLILDPNGNRILLLSPRGELEKVLGGPGEGPGEFRGLTSMRVLDSGQFLAFDKFPLNSFSHFAADFQFKERARNTGADIYLHSAGFSSNGALVSSLFVVGGMTQPKMIVKTGLLDRDFKPIKTLSKHELFSFDPQAAQESQWWVGYMAQWFKLYGGDQGLMAFGPDGTVFTAHANQYEVTRWSKDLKQELVLTKKYKPVYQSEDALLAYLEPLKDEVKEAVGPVFGKMITEDGIKQAIVQAEIPPRKPPIFGMVGLPDGGLLVVTDYDPKSRIPKADWFSPKGQLLGSMNLPPIAVNVFGTYFSYPVKLLFRGDYAYGIETSGDGDVSAVRYKISYD